MTTFLSSIATFKMPMGETIRRVSNAIDSHRLAKAHKECLTKHLELLSAMDSHMLSDIGMTGFNALAADEQELMLLDRIGKAKT